LADGERRCIRTVQFPFTGVVVFVQFSDEAFFHRQIHLGDRIAVRLVRYVACLSVEREPRDVDVGHVTSMEQCDSENKNSGHQTHLPSL